MAEGFAKTLGKGKIEVTSSGLEASRVHPGAIAAMDEIGIDIRSQTSDTIHQFTPQNYDVVISLCGCGVNLPTTWVTRPIFEDWQVEDPDGKPTETFRRARNEIKARVERLIGNIKG